MTIILDPATIIIITGHNKYLLHPIIIIMITKAIQVQVIHKKNKSLKAMIKAIKITPLITWNKKKNKKILIT